MTAKLQDVLPTIAFTALAISDGALEPSTTPLLHWSGRRSRTRRVGHWRRLNVFHAPPASRRHMNTRKVAALSLTAMQQGPTQQAQASFGLSPLEGNVQYVQQKWEQLPFAHFRTQ